MGSLAASLLAVPAMAEVKIGVVDYARLLEESPQAKAGAGSLRAEFGPRYQQIVAQENALKTRGEKLQKDAATMAPDQRTKAEKELRDGARDLERKKQELQDDSNAKRNDEMNKLQRSLIGEVRDYAKAQNFDIVIAEGVIYTHARGRHHPGSPAGTAVPRAEAGGRAGRRSRAREARREALTPGAIAAAPPAMTVTLGELAVRFGCELRGDPAGRRRHRRRAVPCGTARRVLSRQSQTRRATQGHARGRRHPRCEVRRQPRPCRR